MRERIAKEPEKFQDNVEENGQLYRKLLDGWELSLEDVLGEDNAESRRMLSLIPVGWGTPQQAIPQQATPPPPTPPETSMDVDEEWRPIQLPARQALQRQVSEPAPPPPKRPALQRQASLPDAEAAQWLELPRADWPIEVEQHATRMEAQDSGPASSGQGV
ncbi:hypothetical protein AWZ03_014982 [Drosophila navojoa]|uniref:Uncharacterized protein n=1 Tax=Drosophila navojoa TaxID=7232 RepID=A0A484AQ03_DRONA|nr:hypothetical protein AWZ03_014982 [Drosophila navojoa]